MRERDESGPLNESSINKRGLSASHRYDRRRHGTNRCTRNPLFSIQKDPFGETSRLDVSGACLVCIMASPLKLPTSSALFFAASSIPGPLSLSVSSLSIYLSIFLFHIALYSLTRFRQSLVFRARFAPFQSLISIRSYTLFLSVRVSASTSLLVNPMNFRPARSNKAGV